MVSGEGVDTRTPLDAVKLNPLYSEFLEACDPESRAEVSQALQLLQAMTPTPGVEYDWIYDYALVAMKNDMAVTMVLDTKAEKLVGFATAGVGLIVTLAIGLMARIPTVASGLTAMAALPSVICLIISARCALTVMRPMEHGSYPGSMGFLTVADQFSEQGVHPAKFTAALNLEVSRAITRSAVKRKATLLESAHRTLGFALYWLLLPLSASVLTALLK